VSINSTFKIASLYPPLREFMRMPEGTQVIYVVNDFLHDCKLIVNYVARAKGRVIVDAMLAVPLQGGMSENLVKFTVTESAPPANKTGPKLH
jgi:hypothetical protein